MRWQFLNDLSDQGNTCIQKSGHRRFSSETSKKSVLSLFLDKRLNHDPSIHMSNILGIMEINLVLFHQSERTEEIISVRKKMAWGKILEKKYFISESLKSLKSFGVEQSGFVAQLSLKPNQKPHTKADTENDKRTMDVMSSISEMN